MDNVLPDIWITADVDGTTFLNRMRDIADATGRFRSEIPSAHGLASGEYLHLYPLGASPHSQLGAQLIAYEDEGRRVRVEMRARRWNPDPPTYEAYVTAATELIKPLLSEYNHCFGSRRRLGIQTKLSTQPAIPRHVEPYFDHFVGCANMRSLHPNDWNRFYRFIRVCHGRRIQLSESDVTWLLRKAGFDADYADRIGTVYYHGRRLLAM